MKTLYHKLILVHKGALGDFLQTWPTICSLVQSKRFSTLIWAGAEKYLTWLTPLKITRVTYRERLLLDKLYGARTFPKELTGFSILWFGLKSPPTLYPIPDLFFFQGISKIKPVWENYLEELERQFNITPYKDWLFCWRKLFPLENKKIITIFPGSGHRLKNWPMDRFEELACRIKKMGEEVVFVAGPVEKERRILPNNTWDILYPTSVLQLMEILKKTKLCIGNDSGPLHLAGFMGIPTISIFGPTDPQRWAPIEAHVISPSLPCAPCTSLINIKCNTMKCLLNISVERVWEEVKSLL